MLLCHPGTGAMHCPLFLTICQQYLPSLEDKDKIDYPKCEVNIFHPYIFHFLYLFSSFYTLIWGNLFPNNFIKNEIFSFGTDLAPARRRLFEVSPVHMRFSWPGT